ncbi:hypothetical protein [Virgibacillus siamensis]|uniref:hypothetical protein n=1 Tax=Virgibacillus siamensis TaxID=480071 RepID=UPI000986F094|nr:hypothetical protein [Virgibacillus siamensis]
MSINNIKEVILHVGLHKTGTTSIQETMFNKTNNDALLKEGVLYPRCWVPNHSVPLYSAFCEKPETYHANIIRGLSKEEIEQTNRNNLDKLKALLEETDAKKLVLSGEDLSMLFKSNIESFKQYLEGIGLTQAKFRVITYTRNPVKWAISMIQQRMKAGQKYENIFDNLISGILPRLFVDRIGNFVEVFGKEAVEVFPFEDAVKHEFGPVGHFLVEIGIDKHTINGIKKISTNPSMSMFTGNLLAHINEEVPIIKGGKMNEKRYEKDYFPLYEIKGEKYDITVNEKQIIKAVTKIDNDWLNDNFNISYQNEEIVDGHNFAHMETTFKDIKRIYPILSKTLRNSMIKYMEQKLKLPSHLKKPCANLIEELLSMEKKLTAIEEQEQNFQNILGVNKKLDKGVMYRELALLMEAYDQIDAAEIFMGRAKLFRPNGLFIKDKHEQYKKRIKDK